MFKYLNGEWEAEADERSWREVIQMERDDEIKKKLAEEKEKAQREDQGLSPETMIETAKVEV